jgi:hypothetical protein
LPGLRAARARVDGARCAICGGRRHADEFLVGGSRKDHGMAFLI